MKRKTKKTSGRKSWLLVRAFRWIVTTIRQRRDRRVQRRLARSLPMCIDASFADSGIVRIEPPDATSPYADFTCVGTNQHGFMLKHGDNPPITVTYLMQMEILRHLATVEEYYESMDEVDAVQLRNELKRAVNVVERMGLLYT